MAHVFAMELYKTTAWASAPPNKMFQLKKTYNSFYQPVHFLYTETLENVLNQIVLEQFFTMFPFAKYKICTML